MKLLKYTGLSLSLTLIISAACYADDNQLLQTALTLKTLSNALQAITRATQTAQTAAAKQAAAATKGRDDE